MEKRRMRTSVVWCAAVLWAVGSVVLAAGAGEGKEQLKDAARVAPAAAAERAEPASGAAVPSDPLVPGDPVAPREPGQGGRESLRQRPIGLPGGMGGPPFGPSSGPSGLSGPGTGIGPEGRGGMMPNPEERQRARELIRESMPSVQSIMERTPDRFDRLKIYIAFGLRHVRALDRARLAGEEELRAATEAIAADDKLVAGLLDADLDSPAGVEKFTNAMRQRIEPAFDAWLVERQSRIAALRAMLAHEEERLREDERAKGEKIDTQLRQFVELARYAKEHWDEKVEIWPRGGAPGGGGPRGERREGGPPR